MQNVSEWLINNKFSLHLKKTESILFGSKCKLKQKHLNVVCNGTEISVHGVRESANYLGMEINTHVTEW